MGANFSIGALLYNAASNPLRSNGLPFSDYTPRRLNFSQGLLTNMTHVGLHARFVTYLTVDGMKVYGVTSNLVFSSSTGRGMGAYLETVNDSSIRNCVFQGATNENVYIIQSTNTSIANNTIAGEVKYNGSTKSYTGWVRLHGNDGVKFTDNLITGTYVLAYRGTGMDISRNTITPQVAATVANTNYIVNNAIQTDRNFRYSKVSDNVILGAAESGIKFTTTDTNDGSYSIVLSGNYIKDGGLKVNSGYQGIEFSYATNIVSYDNLAESTTANKMTHCLKILTTSSGIRSTRDRFQNLLYGSVWDQTEYSATTNYPAYSKHVRFRRNPSGIVEVPTGITEIAILFPTAEPTDFALTEVLKPFASPRWETSMWFTNIANTGFTVKFGTAPASTNFLYWRIE
jgi:hypothetical protein